MSETTDKRINRRRFLKYGVGITAAAVATAVGVNYFLRPKPVVTPTTSTITPTTPIVSSTTTTLPLSSSLTPTKARLYGKVFHDYNGNGIMYNNELLLKDMKIILKDKDGKEYSAVTDGDGRYELDNLLSGSYKLYLNPKREYPKRDFRYWSKSIDELAMIETRGELIGHNLNLSGDHELNFGLTIGQFTLPFKRGTKYKIFFPFGAKYPEDSPYAGKIHTGTDFVVYSDDKNITKGMPLLASAPGVVVESRYRPIGGNVIRIRHIDSLYGNIDSLYGHLLTSFVLEGDEVKRGQLIGKCGSSGKDPGIPHLHLELDTTTSSPINPYRNINNPSSRCYWTKDNDPQFP